MTVLRSETRATLKIVLNRQLPFTSTDILMESGRVHGDDYRNKSLERQLRLFTELEILERSRAVTGYGRPFIYTLVDRELAQLLVDEKPKPKYRSTPKTKYVTPSGCSFIFHMGN